ncbi:MAG: FAD:protein FMN transferase [Bryobacteraceae bacterium]
MWKKSSLLLLCLPLLAERFERVEPHMGTLFRITVDAPTVEAAHAAFDAAFARVHELDEILSDYKPQSELMKLSVRPMRVSADLFHVLEASQELAEQTGGAFDVTAGPVIRLWRKARRDRALPTNEAIADALGRTGYRKLTLDRAAQTVCLGQQGMQLDSGGIAKGYAADEALRVLQTLGLHDALVAASGDIVVGRKPMSIAVEPAAGFRRRVTLSNAAVSTSGDTEQFLDLDGKRYSHIVDPRNGQALTNRIGVTVAAPRGITSDSLATAVCVMGAERGLRFLKQQPGVSALIVVDGRLVAATGLFARE